jgi:magnesium-transporting ATPase (P-type)
MHRVPREPEAPILDGRLLMRIGLVTLLGLVAAFGFFLWGRIHVQLPLAHAQTIVVNTIVLIETCYLLNCRALKRSMWSVGVFSNQWLIPGMLLMVGLQLLLTYVPVMNRLFHTAPLSVETWLPVITAGMLVYMVVGLEKWLRSRGWRLPVHHRG